VHISEGVLPLWMVGAGWGAAAAGVAVGVRKLKPEKVPTASLFSAVFFVASLVHVPIGPSSVHLLLNGLTGLILGVIAFPVIFIALFLQAVLFQFGGIAVLGINTLNMALPSLACFLLFGRLMQKEGYTLLVAFGTALVGVMFAGLMVALELSLSGEGFRLAARLVLLAHLPVMVVEGVVNYFVLSFFKRVYPEILEGVS